MKRSDFPDTNDEEYKRSRFLPCALQFLYIDDDTLRRLQSLELTSYEDFLCIWIAILCMAIERNRFIGSMFVWKIGSKIKNFAMHWQKNMEEW